MKLLQGGTLSGAEWLPPNQARRLSNLQDSWFFMSGSPSFSRQLWGGGINRDRTSVLMFVESRVRKFRGRHGSCQLVHHHRVGRETTPSVWVGLGSAFGNPSMEAILSCGVPATLNKIWDKTSKLKTRGEVSSEEISVKDGKRDKESVSTGVLLPHKYPFFFK